MVNKIEVNYILEDANKYLGKEVTVILKGYVIDINLINDISERIYVGGKQKPILLGSRTELLLSTTDVKIED